MHKRYGRRYPWDQWFSKKKFVVRRGKDFDCMTHCMAQMIRTRAGGKGIKVRVQVGEDGVITVAVLGRAG